MTLMTAAQAAERYLQLFDRMAGDAAAVDQLVEMFDVDASFQVSKEAEIITGASELREMYKTFGAQLVNSRHMWVFETNTPTTATFRWLQIARWVDDRLVARSGTETITVNSAGKIIAIRNIRTTPDQGR